MDSKAPKKPVVESKSVGGTLTLSERFKSLVAPVKEMGATVKNTLIDKEHYDERAAVVLEQEQEAGAWLTEQDAARHLLAAGNLSRTFGKTGATIGAKLYELILSGGDYKDNLMDAHNNRLGIELGLGAKDDKEVEQRVQKVMEKRKLDDFSDPSSPVFLKIHSPTN